MRDGPFRSMTAGQLKELVEDIISEHGDEILVTVSCNYGDYWRTMQVLELDNQYEVLPIDSTAYSQSGWAVARHEEDEIDEETGERIEDGEPMPRVAVIGWQR